jgi:hypothetical protein
MSILNNESINQPQPAELAAQRLIQITRHTYQQMVNAFNQGSEIFWRNGNGASPSDISSALGTNAKEIFELHYAIGTLIGSVSPESIQEGLSLVGQFTINEDGTVTVIESNTPTE